MKSNRIRAFLLQLTLALLLPTLAPAQISVSVNVAPPELPVYEQPPIPGDGYIWTPGYWAWSDDIQDYYWVPGTWVLAPQPEFLWTPGYWGVEGGLFLWHAGYWGPHVGFYGGVNYGYGYGGAGFEGGYWQGGRLFYNRSVTNINNVSITNVYNKTVVNNVTVNRVSYNGGNGIQARPTAAQMAAAQEHHTEATPAQRQQVELAHANPSLRASQNQGHPPIAATARPGAFSGPGVVGARGAPANTAHSVQPQQRGNVAERPAPRMEAPPHPTAAPRPEPAPRVAEPARPQPEMRAPPPAARPSPPHPPEHAPPEHDEHEHH